MLDWLLGKKKQKPRFFLGKIIVLKRNDLRRFIDQVGFFHYENIEEWLPNAIRAALDLPELETRTMPYQKDYGIDVVIAKYQLGGDAVIDLPEFFIPLFWRPKIYIAIRVFDPDSGKSVFGIEREKKLAWKLYFKRMFSVRAAVGIKTIFDRHDLEPMLLNGLIEIFEEIKSKKLL